MLVALDEGPGPPIKYQYAELGKLYTVVSQLIRCCNVSSRMQSSINGTVNSGAFKQNIFVIKCVWQFIIHSSWHLTNLLSVTLASVYLKIWKSFKSLKYSKLTTYTRLSCAHSAFHAWHFLKKRN